MPARISHAVPMKPDKPPVQTPLAIASRGISGIHLASGPPTPECPKK